MVPAVGIHTTFTLFIKAVSRLRLWEDAQVNRAALILSSPLLGSLLFLSPLLSPLLFTLPPSLTSLFYLSSLLIYYLSSHAELPLSFCSSGPIF